MGSLTISEKILDKYFGYLKDLDDKAKKHLISKLSQSIDNTKMDDLDLTMMYGAWEDDRDSDEIIAEIRSSRVEKINTEGFE